MHLLAAQRYYFKQRFFFLTSTHSFHSCSFCSQRIFRGFAPPTAGFGDWHTDEGRRALQHSSPTKQQARGRLQRHCYLNSFFIKQSSIVCAAAPPSDPAFPRNPCPIFFRRRDAKLGCWISEVQHPCHERSIIDVEPLRNGCFVHEWMLQKCLNTLCIKI